MVGSKTVTRDVRAAYSYLATSDPRVHFGLGAAIGVQSVTVRWPNGQSQNFGDFPADRIVTLRQQSGGKPVAVPKATGR